jgi:hypothetical protein
MLLCYFKSSGVVFGALLLLGACSIEPQIETVSRENMDIFLSGNISSSDIEGQGLVLEGDIYSPARFMTACAWLDSLEAQDQSEKQGFRILEDYGTRKSSLRDIFPFTILPESEARYAKDLPFLDNQPHARDCEPTARRTIRPHHRGGSHTARLPNPRACRSSAIGPARGSRKEVIDLANLYGRVQIADNPLYEFGLMGQMTTALPDKEGFFAEIDAIIKRSPIMILPLLAYRSALRLGVLSVYEERNEIVQKKISEELPGVYDRDFKIFKIKNTFPDILIKNGAPFVEVLRPLPTDSREEIMHKDEELKGILASLSKRLPMFRDNTWVSFREDMRWGMSAAIRGTQSTSPREQACGAAIFHRAFAQMISIKGYDRIPLEFHQNSNGKRWVLSDVEKFLEHKKSTRIRSCRATGSFLRGTLPTQVADDELADSAGTRLQLAESPLALQNCELRDAEVLIPASERGGVAEVVVGPARGVLPANLQQKLEFMSGIAYFNMTFMPGASWWFSDKAIVPYPLTDFGDEKELQDILTSGGLLPYEAFALSLGFLNLAGNNLIDDHLVYVDKNNKEVGADADILGVRISTHARTRFSKAPVVTDLRAVLLLTDVVFKLHESLKKMSDWYDVFKETGSANEKQAFIKGMFASEETLQMLTETGPDSVRKQIDDFRLALALLVAKYAKPEGRDANGQIIYSCYDQLVLDPVTGVESKEGLCAQKRQGAGLFSDQEMWRQVMRLVGRAFQSPLYLEMGREIP